MQATSKHSGKNGEKNTMSFLSQDRKKAANKIELESYPSFSVGYTLHYHYSPFKYKKSNT